MDALGENGPVLLAGLGGVAVTLMITMLMNKQPAPAATSSNANANANANKKKKQKKKNKNKSKSIELPVEAPEKVQEPEPEPEPEPVEEAPKPEPSASKKKKKKKNKKAEEEKKEEPPEPVEEPEPEPVSVAAEAAAEPETAGKKKKKKKKKKGAAAAAAAAADAAKSKASADDDDDSDDDLFGLLSPQQIAKTAPKPKKKKAENNVASTNDSMNGGGWNTIATKKGKTPAPPPAPVPTKPEGRIQLTPEDVPTLIGPKGATISQITASSGAKLDIRDKELIITGTEDQIAQATLEVKTLLSTESAKRKEATAHSKTLMGSIINGSDGVKAIIGRGGSTIKGIQTTTGCQLNANIEAGTVIISGPTEDAVSSAVTLCHHAVFGESSCRIDLGSKSMVFSVCGKGFSNIQQLQKDTGARLDLEKGGFTLTIRGDTEPVATAKRTVEEWISSRTTFTMEFESSKIGAVFGKGGTTLRKIQERTNTQIEINQNGSTAKCEIVGVATDVKVAQGMVEKSLIGEVIELKPGEIRDTVELGVGTSAVIGRKGANIAELEKKHSVKLNVQSGTTGCSIVGKEKNVEEAKAEIEGIVKPLIEKAIEEAKILEQSKALEASGDETWTAVVDDDADGW